jgi:hypothetical protein
MTPLKESLRRLAGSAKLDFREEQGGKRELCLVRSPAGSPATLMSYLSSALWRYRLYAC